eukprot:scaffold1486_cov329-Prasinococcus_capsulatus_cf.AAC.22
MDGRLNNCRRSNVNLQELYKQLFHLRSAAEDTHLAGLAAGALLTHEVSMVQSHYKVLASVENVGDSATSVITKFPRYYCQGEKEVYERERRFVFDLCYNGTRWASWFGLAELYDSASELLLNDACKLLDCREFAQTDRYAQAIRVYRERCHMSLLKCIEHASNDGDMAEMEEMLGLCRFDMIQNVPPAFDNFNAKMVWALACLILWGGLDVPTMPRDSSWVAALTDALAHFRNASALLPREWSYWYYQGKLLEKMGSDNIEAALASYVKAIVRAPTLIEPFYRLHASRLKVRALTTRSLTGRTCSLSLSLSVTPFPACAPLTDKGG